MSVDLSERIEQIERWLLGIAFERIVRSIHADLAAAHRLPPDLLLISTHRAVSTALARMTEAIDPGRAVAAVECRLQAPRPAAAAGPGLGEPVPNTPLGLVLGRRSAESTPGIEVRIEAEPSWIESLHARPWLRSMVEELVRRVVPLTYDTFFSIRPAVAGDPEGRSNFFGRPLGITTVLR